MVLNSVKLNLDKLHYHGDELKKLISGKYEIGENAIMKNTMTSDDVVLELGISLGYNSIFANKVIGSEVHSNEANPELIPIIKKNVALNNTILNLYNKVILVNPTQKFISFNVANHYTGSSTLPLDAQTTLKKAYQLI